MKKRSASIIFILLICAMLSYPANAQSQVVIADVYQGTIFVDGEIAQIDDQKNHCILPLSYKDSVYVPYEALGSWLGVDVAWNDNQNMISLGITALPNYHVILANYSLEASFDKGKIQCEYDTPITVNYGGRSVNCYNNQGDALPALKYKNMIYLPIRPIAELIGKEIVWVKSDSTQSIYISRPFTSDEITQGKLFLAESFQLLNSASEIAKEMNQTEWKNGKDYNMKAQEMLATLQDVISKMRELKWVDSNFAESHYRLYQGNLDKILDAVTTFDTSLGRGQNFSRIIVEDASKMDTICYLDQHLRPQLIMINQVLNKLP